MIGVRRGLAAALIGLVVLLLGLAAAPGIHAGGVAAGLACGTVLGVAAARSARRAGVETWGPADLVTLGRAALACGVGALVVDSAAANGAAGGVPALVGLACVALVLDAVDGRVARRTGTTSPLGARLDGEADAFLMLVLSAYVATTAGPWVLAVGLVRYVFAVAGWGLPWLRADLPPRYWRKVVTATAGIALVVAAADVSVAATYAGLALAALLLAESFGRDVAWLWRRRRHEAPCVAPAAVAPAPHRPVGLTSR
jgi:phosphatidylglycerophosphate synthase